MLPATQGDMATHPSAFLPALERDELPADRAFVLLFSAQWCGPCRPFAPRVEAAVTALGDCVELIKVDTEALPDVASRFGIRSVPTLVAVTGGSERGRHCGAIPDAALRRWLDTTLSPSAAACSA